MDGCLLFYTWLVLWCETVTSFGISSFLFQRAFHLLSELSVGISAPIGVTLSLKASIPDNKTVEAWIHHIHLRLLYKCHLIAHPTESKLEWYSVWIAERL